MKQSSPDAPLLTRADVEGNPFDAPDYAHPLLDHESRGRSARRPQGGNMDEFELSISAEIRNVQRGDRLHIGETMTIKAGTMLEILAVLGKFHELAQTLRNSERVR